MKRLFSCLAVNLALLTPGAWADGDDAPREQDLAPQHLSKKPKYFQIENVYTSNVVLRVGSPIFVAFRNLARMDRDCGSHLSEVDHMLLSVESLPDVNANSVLIMSGSDSYDPGTPLRTVVVNYDPHKSVGHYMWNQATGLFEIVLEDALIYPSWMVLRGLFGPAVDVAAAGMSDTISGRYVTSGLAIWDSVKGVGYTFADAGLNLADGDVMRSLKALIRVPFAITEVGLTTLGKVIRLPVDLVMSAIFGFQEVNRENDDIRAEFNDLQARTHVLAQRMLRNSEYEGTFSRAGAPPYKTRLELASGRQGQSGRFLVYGKDGSYYRNFKWKVFPAIPGQSDDYVVMQHRPYAWAEREPDRETGPKVLYVALVRGSSDVRLSGKIVRVPFGLDYLGSAGVNGGAILHSVLNGEYPEATDLGSFDVDD